MYDPVRDGLAKSVDSVSYVEVDPPSRLTGLVHRYWQMRTEVDHAEDVYLHALPDACVNVLFDRADTRIAGVTALHTEHTVLNLGRSFHYVGVQFYPGVWRGAPEGTVDHYVGEPYKGALPLIETGHRLVGVDLAEMEPALTEFVLGLESDGVIASNPVIAAILAQIGEITSVADMAATANLSARQLQRTVKATTGFSPHDLLKVLRIQHSFRQDYRLSFADQSHFTNSFRQLTGCTPAQFGRTFDVG